MSADGLISEAEALAAKLRYLAERVRDGERLDDGDRALLETVATKLVVQDTVIRSTDDRMTAAMSILGRTR